MLMIVPPLPPLLASIMSRAFIVLDTVADWKVVKFMLDDNVMFFIETG